MAHRITVALLLLAASGCRILEHDAEVRLEPAGAVTTAVPISLRIVTQASGEARLLLDGVELPGRPPVNRAFQFEVPKRNGTYRLTARVHDGVTPIESAATLLTVDLAPPRVVSLSPPQELFFLGGTFTVRYDLDQPATRVLVTSVNGPRAADDLWSSLPRAVTRSADGRQIEVVVSGMGALGASSLVLRGTACNEAGACASLDRTWSAVTLDLRPVVTPAGPWVRGVVQVAAPAVPVALTTLDLLVDGRKRGAVAPGGVLPLDTTQLADGFHSLAFAGRGVVSVNAVLLGFDNTPPRAACAPLNARADDVAVRAGVVVTFDEPVRRPSTNLEGEHVWLPEPGALPRAWTVPLDQAVDQAGNPPVAVGTCTFDLPAWRRPFPVDTITSGREAAQLAVVSATAPDSSGADRAELLVVTASGDTAGWVQRYAGTAPGALGGVEYLGGRAGPVGLTGRGGGQGIFHWIEATPIQTALLRFRPGEFGSAGMSVPSSALRPVFSVQAPVVGWLEEVAGVAALRFMADPAFGEPLLASAEGGGAVEGATVGPFGVAYAQRPAGGGPARLFTRAYDGVLGTLSAPVGPLNRDAAAGAAEPSLEVGLAGLLAWQEDGDVLVRPATPEGSGWGDLAVLDSNPALPARWPRTLGDRVVFVEREAGRDRFEVRRHIRSGWEAGPSLDTGGIVTAYALSGTTPMAIAWIGTDGLVRLRVLNE